MLPSRCTGFNRRKIKIFLAQKYSIFFAQTITADEISIVIRSNLSAKHTADTVFYLCHSLGLISVI